jgi:hypothetical protein
MIILLLSLVSLALSPDVPYYRRMMGASLESEDSARAFYNHTRKIEDTGPSTLLGYKAMSEFMMCNHVSGPFNKLEHFNKGKKMLEWAIERDGNNAELRFMRFCTQDNVPAMLHYRDELDEDKEFLIDYLKQVEVKDKTLKALIKNYLQDHRLCSSREQQTIKKL